MKSSEGYLPARQPIIAFSQLNDLAVHMGCRAGTNDPLSQMLEQGVLL
jgi:hypothetical protein